MTDFNPLVHSTDPETNPEISLPGEGDEPTDLTELQREGLNIEDEQDEPDKELKLDHPTPNHPTGRMTP